LEDLHFDFNVFFPSNGLRSMVGFPDVRSSEIWLRLLGYDYFEIKVSKSHTYYDLKEMKRIRFKVSHAGDKFINLIIKELKITTK